MPAQSGKVQIVRVFWIPVTDSMLGKDREVDT